MGTNYRDVRQLLIVVILSALTQKGCTEHYVTKVVLPDRRLLDRDPEKKQKSARKTGTDYGEIVLTMTLPPRIRFRVY